MLCNRPCPRTCPTQTTSPPHTHPQRTPQNDKRKIEPNCCKEVISNEKIFRYQTHFISLLKINNTDARKCLLLLLPPLSLLFDLNKLLYRANSWRTCAGEDNGLLIEPRRDFLNVLFRLYFSILSVTTISISLLLTGTVGETTLVDGFFVVSGTSILSAFTGCTGRTGFIATFFKLKRNPINNCLTVEDYPV